jgi:hypothetical protein
MLWGIGSIVCLSYIARIACRKEITMKRHNLVPIAQRKRAIKSLDELFGMVPFAIIPPWLAIYATFTPIVPGVRRYTRAIIK